MANARGDKADNTPIDLLSKFLGDLGQLPRIMTEGMLNQAENEDEKEVIRSLGGILEGQFSELAGFIRARSGRLSAQQRQDTEQVLRLSSAESVIASGSALAANLVSPVAKIGLAGIIRDIKKIIRMLLEAFGIRIPRWLEVLLLLIDEIVNLFFSTGSPALANTLSRMEQDHLAELTQLARLQRESEVRADLDNEET